MPAGRNRVATLSAATQVIEGKDYQLLAWQLR
jgi:hypothetical protein